MSGNSMQPSYSQPTYMQPTYAQPTYRQPTYSYGYSPYYYGSSMYNYLMPHMQPDIGRAPTNTKTQTPQAPANKTPTRTTGSASGGQGK